MQAMRRPFLMLVLLIFTSLSPLLTSGSADVKPAESEVNSLMSEEERLALAASMWHVASASQPFSIPLQPASGVLQMNVGSFDPLADVHPEPSGVLFDANDFQATGLAIVQLHAHDGTVLDDLIQRHGIAPLDFIGDEGWLIRLPSPPAASLRALHEDDDVRWVGSQHPGWRLDSTLASGLVAERLALVPASDLAIGGFEQLSLDLIRMGAQRAWCGIGVCEIELSQPQSTSFLLNVIQDGRIIWIEPTVEFSLHNALAAAAVGVIDVRNDAMFTLDGSGEMIAIADTGLDQDHPDLTGRVAAVYTQYGLDASPADSNTGHGTHIAISTLGGGNSNSSATGIAPNADLVMYALEHDPTGVFGRIGSIYDLLRDAEQMTARVAINAWGANGNYGQYTADSRSVDILVHDKPDMLPLFSVGDRGAQGASQVTAPGTAKNVLAIGASGTGTTLGTVAAFSSMGPSLDGRVKPDLVAPGVDVCSGRAEEAKTSPGLSCSSETHGNGDEMYTSLSGTSQATAVAGGVAALTREFIREQVGINAPSGSLVKAAMINGARDIGAPDIPNAEEGWGQVDINRTVLPVWDSSSPVTTALTTFMDDNTPLDAGFGLLYAFDMDASHGIDITLVWSDEAGSANAAQGESRLVNNLDLVLVDPSGNQWFGNNFANGFTTSSQTSDSINNVERIKVAPGTLTQTGQWLVKVLHRGGTTQDFGLVITADATPNPQADLALYNGSIIPSSPEPLRNDLIAIRIGWINQGTLATGNFHVIFEDLTSGDILFEGDRPALAAGTIDSLLIQHQFLTTGPHSMRLRVDTNDQVAEMNDGNTGVDNNIWEQEIEVTALGVRVVALNDDGSVPTTSADRESAAVKIFDVRNQTGIDIPIHILHEGTGQKNVTLSVTNVQVPQPGRPDFLLSPDDVWTKSVSENGPYTIQGQGEIGDFKLLTIHLEDEYADLDDPDDPRYARAGTFVVDVTARYQGNPTVAHTQRLTFVIEQLDEVLVTPLGTDGLEAEPGSSAGFRISVANIGNSPAQYTISCTSENRWQVMLKDTNSSTLEIEPIGIRQYRAIKIDLYVPPVVDGAPVTGS
ncbi:MAG: S8 family serine peptidase, partial [Euryarchaeota archaeon]